MTNLNKSILLNVIKRLSEYTINILMKSLKTLFNLKRLSQTLKSIYLKMIKLVLKISISA